MKKFIKINFDRALLLSREIRQYLNFRALFRKVQIGKLATSHTYKAIFFLGLSAAVAGIGYYFFLPAQDKLKFNNQSVLSSALKEFDVKPESFYVDASKGDTIHVASGTQIIIPANCFVDEFGKKVSGKVEIQYREFQNNKDIICSGISMAYDSGGVKNYFESAGMMEINASQNKNRLFIGSGNTIGVDLATSDNKPEANLYSYDTLKNNWVVLGKDSINSGLSDRAEKYFFNNKTDISGDSLFRKALNYVKMKQSYRQLIKEKPIAPKLEDLSKFSFGIDFEKEDFKELSAFENIKFEVCDSRVQIKDEDTTTIWEHVSLSKTNADQYLVKFSTTKKSISYEVVPVFDASSIGNAKKVFDKNFATYKKQLADKEIAKELARKKLAEALILEQQKAAQLREKQLKEANERLIADKAAAKKAINDAYKLEQEQMKEQMQLMNEEQKKLVQMASALSSITRSFKISNFGIYNCDRIMKNLVEAPIEIQFSESLAEDKIIAFYVVIKDIRSAIICNPTFKLKNQYKISFSKNSIFKIVAFTTSKKIAVGDANEPREAIETKTNKIDLKFLDFKVDDDKKVREVLNF